MDKSIDELIKFIKKIEEAPIKAQKRAMKRAQTKAKVITANEIKSELNLKPTKIKANMFVKLTQEAVEITLKKRMSNLIHFVPGKIESLTNTKPKKGIPVNVKYDKKYLPHSFITSVPWKRKDGTGGRHVGVFERSNPDNPKKIRELHTTSVADIGHNEDFAKRVLDGVSTSFVNNFWNAFEYFSFGKNKQEKK